MSPSRYLRRSLPQLCLKTPPARESLKQQRERERERQQKETTRKKSGGEEGRVEHNFAAIGAGDIFGQFHRGERWVAMGERDDDREKAKGNIQRVKQTGILGNSIKKKGY